MNKWQHYGKYAWLLPLVLHGLDAHAWGLITHVYFAQWLIWATPLLDPRLRLAVQKFPDLVMAGACLPDLALVSPSFRHTHQWQICNEMLLSARSDEEIAVSVGYASHLFVDVVAHNHFVPAHEAMWIEQTLLTHISSEWAMDAHLGSQVNTTPHKLLSQNHSFLASFLGKRFRCGEKRASRALRNLANADRLLRTIRLPHLLYRCFKCLDREVFDHFVYYISQTQAMLPQMDSLLNGAQPVWEADPPMQGHNVLKQWRQYCLSHLKQRHPTPIEHYSAKPLIHDNPHVYSMKETLAMHAPMMAPISTSVG